MSTQEQEVPVLHSVQVEDGPEAIDCPACGAIVKRLKNGLPGRHSHGGFSVSPERPACEGCKKGYSPTPLVSPSSGLVVLADLLLDTDKLMLDGIDTTGGPMYSVSELAQFFFGRSPHWVRWLETEKRMVLDGVTIKPIRTTSNARKYDLALVERIAHALASNRTIDGEQLLRALLLVRIQAEINEFLGVEAPEMETP